MARVVVSISSRAGEPDNELTEGRYKYLHVESWRIRAVQGTDMLSHRVQELDLPKGGIHIIDLRVTAVAIGPDQ